MQYKNLGRSGLRVSQLSYGSWVTFGNQLDVKEAKALLQACRDAGVNFFDNAEVYANGRAEEIMGQAIRDLGWRRSDIVLSTKLFWGGQGPNDRGLSRKHVVEGLGASLRRLGTDYVDVVYCHRPDASTPVEETVRAMNWVIDQGWAFYWGTSEWSAQQITEAWGVANRLDLVGPIVEQPEYNLFSRHKVESEFLPLYSTYGIGLTTWSPLASGVLSGKYGKGNIPADSRFALDNYKNLANRSLVDETLRKVNGLKPIASELGVSLAQLSIAWCASNPNVSSVITGATKESQIVENMKALDVIPLLTPEVVDRIEAVVQTKPKRTESYRAKYETQDFLKPSLRISSKSSFKSTTSVKSVASSFSSTSRKDATEDSREFVGELNITVVRGTNMAVRDMLTSDPYVILSLGEQKAQTTVKKSDLNPVWNEVLKISVPRNYGPLKLQVYDHDMFSADDIMGEAEVDLQPMITAAMAFGDTSRLGDMQIGRWFMTKDNALLKDSTVNVVAGKVKQEVHLKLQNVESGEIELELEWVSL